MAGKELDAKILKFAVEVASRNFPRYDGEGVEWENWSVSRLVPIVESRQCDLVLKSPEFVASLLPPRFSFLPLDDDLWQTRLDMIENERRDRLREGLRSSTNPLHFIRSNYDGFFWSES